MPAGAGAKAASVTEGPACVRACTCACVHLCVRTPVRARTPVRVRGCGVILSPSLVLVGYDAGSLLTMGHGLWWITGCEALGPALAFPVPQFPWM